MMLSQNQIRDALIKTANKYPIKSVSLFGSYADGNANEDSDVDLLVEFLTPTVSLFMLYELKLDVETELKKNVDLVHLPIPPNSIIKINKVVTLYEN